MDQKLRYPTEQAAWYLLVLHVVLALIHQKGSVECRNECKTNDNAKRDEQRQNSAVNDVLSACERKWVRMHCDAATWVGGPVQRRVHHL